MSTEKVSVIETLQDRVRKRRQFIREHGQSRMALKVVETRPDWFDPDKFQYAQRLFKTFKTSLFFAYVYGLTLVVHHPEELIPLLINGRSSKISHLYQRYFSTIKAIISWNECDPFDSEGEAWRYFAHIRSSHIKVEQRLRTRLSTRRVWINQHRMCNAQFSFIGLMTVFPNQLGFQTLTAKDFNALFHFWRTVGYCLGTEDPFNLCSGTDEETIELCRQIYYEEWQPVLKHSMKTMTIATRLSKAMMMTFNQLDGHITYNVLMKYAHGFLGTPVVALESYHEIYCYWLTVLFFKFCAKFKSFHWLMAQWMDFRLKQATIHKQQFLQYLDRKFPGNLFDEREILDLVSDHANLA